MWQIIIKSSFSNVVNPRNVFFGLYQPSLNGRFTPLGESRCIWSWNSTRNVLSIPHDASWGLLESRIVKNLISIYLYLYLSIYPYIHISISVCNHHFAHGNCRFFWVSMDNPRPNPPAPDARARSRAGVGSARAVAADAPRRA